jgi:hypothetical protein
MSISIADTFAMRMIRKEDHWAGRLTFLASSSHSHTAAQMLSSLSVSYEDVNFSRNGISRVAKSYRFCLFGLLVDLRQ